MGAQGQALVVLVMVVEDLVVLVQDSGWILE
jgi:hypothetical protein